MSSQVVNGASMTCTFGVAPSSLVVLPTNRVTCGNVPAATIMDHAPMINIMPFGMCTSISNPTVASATAAASGVLTPMPCVPNTPAPWTPGSAVVLIGYMPSLHNTSTCNCLWGGVIQIVSPGQFGTMLP